jgi:tetratricopeptide (TPR) repeat protein
MCYNQMGEFQRALYDFSVAIRIEVDKGESKNNKHLADCYNMAGNQHYALAQLEEAYNHYHKAIELDSQGQYYFNRGLV